MTDNSGRGLSRIGNPFNQNLNTTSNVNFNKLTLADRLDAVIVHTSNIVALGNGHVSGDLVVVGELESKSLLNGAGGETGDVLVGNGTTMVALPRGPPGAMLTVQDDDTNVEWTQTGSYLYKSTTFIDHDGLDDYATIIGPGVGYGLTLQQSWVDTGARIHIRIDGAYKNVEGGTHAMGVAFNGYEINSLVLPTYDDVLPGNFALLPYVLEYQIQYHTPFILTIYTKFHPQYQPYAHAVIKRDLLQDYVDVYPATLDVTLFTANTFNRHHIYNVEVRVSN
jgi:hypothetical protein